MTNWIERYVEPKKLFLAWQAPDHMKERFRWAVGELAVDRGRLTSLRYFQEGPEFSRLNDGRPFERLRSLGYGGYPAFQLKRDVHTEGVAEAFMRRLPPISRPDFAQYRAQFRLGEGVPLNEANLLSVTEAKLPSDGFSIVDPLDADADTYDLFLELAGYRYNAQRVHHLIAVGKQLTIEREPDNPKDPLAVRFVLEGETLGYVNRLQVRAFQHWLGNARVHAVVERLNGRPEHPKAFAFVQVRPRAHAEAA